MKEQIRLDVKIIHSPRGPTINGINYLLTVSMLVVLIIMLKNRIDKYIVRPIRILRTVCYSDMWHLNETHEG